MLPELGVTMPERHWIKVLLPALFAPSSPISSPSAISIEMSCRTVAGPYPAVSDLTSSMVIIVAEIGLADFLIGQHFFWRAFGDLLTEVEHHHPVGGFHDDGHHV